jgi:dienelactone hydrolase
LRSFSSALEKDQMRKSIAALVTATTLGFSGANAQPVARGEVYPIPSVTLTTDQILSNNLEGKPVTLKAELRIPNSGTNRLAAVILIHGSGGIRDNIDMWAKEINALGVAAFILDSFSGRGIVTTATDQSQLDSLAMMTDAYRALAVLSRNPRIDPARIAIMGISKGALAAVYSSNVRFRKLYAPAGAGFAAHIGMYTPCNMQFRGDDKITGAPIRLFHGSADDMDPVAPCREYVARLRKAGADATLTEFPGAYHAYDSHGLPPPAVAQTMQNARNCAWHEDDKGEMVNTKTGAAYSYKDPCIEYGGAHFGYNQAAAEATVVAVRDFLKSAFKLQAITKPWHPEDR